MKLVSILTTKILIIIFETDVYIICILYVYLCLCAIQKWRHILTYNVTSANCTHAQIYKHI